VALVDGLFTIEREANPWGKNQTIRPAEAVNPLGR
jgi:hypothetical protein